jgi:hypothetical protein
LAAAITVEDGVVGGASLEGLVERVQDQIRTHVVGQTPTHDAPRTQIDDHGQVEPSRAGRDEGDVARPDAIGSRGQGLAGEEIGRRACRPGRRWFWAGSSWAGARASFSGPWRLTFGIAPAADSAVAFVLRASTIKSKNWINAQSRFHIRARETLRPPVRNSE